LSSQNVVVTAVDKHEPDVELMVEEMVIVGDEFPRLTLKITP